MTSLQLTGDEPAGELSICFRVFNSTLSETAGVGLTIMSVGLNPRNQPGASNRRETIRQQSSREGNCFSV
jgi:hypothetical protein